MRVRNQPSSIVVTMVHLQGQGRTVVKRRHQGFVLVQTRLQLPKSRRERKNQGRKEVRTPSGNLLTGVAHYFTISRGNKGSHPKERVDLREAGIPNHSWHILALHDLTAIISLEQPCPRLSPHKGMYV